MHYRKREAPTRDEKLAVPMTLSERAEVKWLKARLRCSEAEIARRAMRELYQEERRKAAAGP